MEIGEKYELRFFEGFKALKKEIPNKKKLERGKRRGKRQVQEFGYEM
jgi:hypothetical protein